MLIDNKIYGIIKKWGGNMFPPHIKIVPRFPPQKQKQIEAKIKDHSERFRKLFGEKTT